MQNCLILTICLRSLYFTKEKSVLTSSQLSFITCKCYVTHFKKLSGISFCHLVNKRAHKKQALSAKSNQNSTVRKYFPFVLLLKKNYYAALKWRMFKRKIQIDFLFYFVLFASILPPFSISLYQENILVHWNNHDFLNYKAGVFQTWIVKLIKTSDFKTSKLNFQHFS